MLGGEDSAFDRYTDFVRGMKVYPKEFSITYPALGLAEEAGEAAGKVKKWLRGDTPELNKDALIKELGDVLWYVTALADDLGVSLRDVAIANMDKLDSRKQRGQLKGSGDDR